MQEAVISLSKIKISKAIHNRKTPNSLIFSAVISLSKIKISKAIHNDSTGTFGKNPLLSVYQR